MSTKLLKNLLYIRSNRMNQQFYSFNKIRFYFKNNCWYKNEEIQRPAEIGNKFKISVICNRKLSNLHNKQSKSLNAFIIYDGFHMKNPPQNLHNIFSKLNTNVKNVKKSMWNSLNIFLGYKILQKFRKDKENENLLIQSSTFKTSSNIFKEKPMSAIIIFYGLKQRKQIPYKQFPEVHEHMKNKIELSNRQPIRKKTFKRTIIILKRIPKIRDKLLDKNVNISKTSCELVPMVNIQRENNESEENLVSKKPPLKKNRKKEVKRTTWNIFNKSVLTWPKIYHIFLVTTVICTTIISYLFLEFGKASRDAYGKEKYDEFSHLPIHKQYIKRMIRELSFYKKLITEPSREKLLPDPVKPPYYQPPYTLVLELTDVLVHSDWTYQTGWRFKKRPGLENFLESLKGVYEIVIFTSEPGQTAFPVVEAIDGTNVVSYKLVRDATTFNRGHYVKDLSKLNRDLRKVIVIDCNPESLKFQRENLFLLPHWDGNDNDTSLIDLAFFLNIIAQSNVEDVREVLQHYKQYKNPLNTVRERQKMLFEKQERNKTK